MPLHLKNPHSVLAALDQRPQDVHWVAIPRGGGGDAWQVVAERAQALGIRVGTEGDAEGFRGHGARRKGGGGGPGKSGREGGAMAEVREREPSTIEEIFAADAAAEEGAAGRLWLALDCIQDPHNLGAIFRTAAFFGVRGLIVLADRSAPLSDTAYDVASGGVEYVPHAIVTNLRTTLERAKEEDIWVLGTSEHAERELGEVDLSRKWLAVLGNEEKGLRRLTLESCDEVCRIAPRGGVTSLNVSVAAGVIVAHMTGGIPANPK